MIGGERLSPVSNWRSNKPGANPPWIGGTCDIAPATVGPDLQHKSRLALALVPPVSAWSQRPTSSDLISRNLGVIGLALSCWSRPFGLASHGASSPAGSPRRGPSCLPVLLLIEAPVRSEVAPVVHEEMYGAGLTGRNAD